MTAQDRREEILTLLSLRRRAQIKDLSARFMVTTRTIKDDIKALSFSNSIYTVQGNGGGIFALEGWRHRQRSLTNAQEEFLKRILAGLQTGEDKAQMEEILEAFSGK